MVHRCYLFCSECCDSDGELRSYNKKHQCWKYCTAEFCKKKEIPTRLGPKCFELKIGNDSDRFKFYYACPTCKCSTPVVFSLWRHENWETSNDIETFCDVKIPCRECQIKESKNPKRKAEDTQKPRRKLPRVAEQIDNKNPEMYTARFESKKLVHACFNCYDEVNCILHVGAAFSVDDDSLQNGDYQAKCFCEKDEDGNVLCQKCADSSSSDSERD